MDQSASGTRLGFALVKHTCFPNAAAATAAQHLVAGRPTNTKQPQRKIDVLEGEMLMDDYGQAKHRRRRGRAIRVGLLVDKNEYQTHFPFLQRLDEDVDLASLPEHGQSPHNKLFGRQQGDDSHETVNPATIIWKLKCYYR
jgi:hypothetical protein